MGPGRYGVGWGGKGRVPCASSGADRLRTCWRIYVEACAPSSQTPLDALGVYKTHTFVCWLDRLNYRLYNALEGWVATLA